jgi:di/tricarboxylate transporter
MEIHAVVVLGITIIATILFIGGWLRPDLVALMVLVSLGITQLVTAEQALAGFSGSAVITILAITIIAEGLHQTGISHRIGQFMKKIAGTNENRLITIVILSGASLSIFMNNIAAMSVLLPATMSLSRQTRVPPSRLLMPLAFGVISGGMATLFTTSNIIASSALKEAGFSPFGLLDFLPIGVPVILVTILYIRYIGKKLLPERNPAGEMEQFHMQREELLNLYDLTSSLWEIEVRRGSGVAGLTIKQGDWRKKIRVNVIGITRQGTFYSSPGSDMLIREGDLVLAQGNPDIEAMGYYGLKLLAERPGLKSVLSSEASIAEIALAPHSNIEGKSLREIHFREKYNLTVLALWRAGKAIHIDFAALPLKIGDSLLVKGEHANLRILSREHDFIFLEEDPDAIPRPGKSRLATVIGLIALVIGIAGWYPISLVAMGGAVAMLLTGCLSMDRAYSSIDWKAIFLIAGIWPLSTAINTSGLSDQFVQSLMNFSSQASPFLIISLILVVTMLLTNIMAGQAVAPIILAPIGLSIAKSTGLDPRMMLMTIALGCSLAYPTPIGHPVNIIVMGSGGYTYRDFLKAGFPLVILIFGVILVGLKLFWAA